MDDGYRWLEGIANRMKKEIDSGAAATPESLTVRGLLWKFGNQRRSDWINSHIRNGLERFKLRTDEDFTIAWLDSTISIELDSDAHGAPRSPHTPDLTYRIGALEAANREPETVKPDSHVEAAITKMQMSDYSRLPVMRTNREVSGIVTWKSIATRLAQKHERNFVHDCMERAAVIPADTRLFIAMRTVAENGHVLVQAKNKIITGIVTATDLLSHLGQLAEPFLFVEEIERHLRNLVHGKFTLDRLQKAAGDDKPIEGSADLTFGGYCQLLQNKDNWERLGLNLDRKVFADHLDSVREIRNSVMHFNPDGLDDDQRRKLKTTARFFDRLTRDRSAS